MDAAEGRIIYQGRHSDLSVTEDPLLVGLAHECQQEDKIPCENWDVALDYIATDTALYRCRGE